MHKMLQILQKRHMQRPFYHPDTATINFFTFFTFTVQFCDLSEMSSEAAVAAALAMPFCIAVVAVEKSRFLSHL